MTIVGIGAREGQENKAIVGSTVRNCANPPRLRQENLFVSVWTEDIGNRRVSKGGGALAVAPRTGEEWKTDDVTRGGNGRWNAFLGVDESGENEGDEERLSRQNPEADGGDGCGKHRPTATAAINEDRYPRRKDGTLMAVNAIWLR
ncbi:hypothetical protein CCHR01_07648 [Colletotrichum chrysophilum]|uniref:Uncharacterized protein n=1 Tax=Colletotrichum chrysophilum TaxID=1836956 RepID=A0AAD9AL92_9PEZI|nr:hypothetical protein CCHR01_07648 [Colletotrichum chrysophilum]